jgi:hypothetical protein
MRPGRKLGKHRGLKVGGFFASAVAAKGAASWSLKIPDYGIQVIEIYIVLFYFNSE